MPSWHERFVTKAKTDAVLRRQLHELARLDALAMTNSSNILSNEWSQVAQKVNSLCDQAARRVVEPGEEVDEAAQWISYNCQKVARAVPAARSPVGTILGLLVAVIFITVLYRWYQSLILAVLGGVAVLSLFSWIRSVRRR